MEIFSQWRDALAGVLHQTVDRLAQYLPNLLGAFLLLLVGWVVAHPLRSAAVRLTLLGERALARIFFGPRRPQWRERRSASC